MRKLQWTVHLLLAFLLLRASALPSPLISDELGCSPTLSVLLGRRVNEPLFYFDPLKLASDDNFAWFREVELKHGRVAMMAQTQILCTPVLHKLVPNNLPHSLFFGHYTLSDGVKVVLACGMLEGYFVQQDPQDMPGDYGTGYFWTRDKGRHEEKLVVELEHGRLAMMGVVGFLVSDLVTNGQPWVVLWRDIASGVLQTLARALADVDKLSMQAGVFASTRGKRVIIGKGRHEEKLVVELEHGRLAMMGVVGFLVSDLVTNGQPWVVLWRDIASGVLQTLARALADVDKL